jgi:flagellar hook-length control protein FliK
MAAQNELLASNLNLVGGDLPGVSLSNQGLAQPEPLATERLIVQLLAQVVPKGAEVVGRQELTLQLDPPHLGKVEVQLQAENKQLVITLKAETAEAETALRARSHELVEGIIQRSDRWSDVQVRLERQEPSEREQRSSGREDSPRREQQQRRDKRDESQS